MGRKVLTQEERFALAQKRGYSAQSTPDRQNLLNQTEQRSLADATKNKHEDVGELWQEYVRVVTRQRFTYGDIIRFLAVRGLNKEALLRPDSAIFKDFVEYYASSRYGRIDELPTVHSVVNV